MNSRSTNRWLVLFIVSVALCLITLDITVLYTALPRLTHDLHASATEKLWIVNVYPLLVSGLLLGTGTLGDRFGHKRLFLTGLVIFGLASWAAAYAPTPAALIAARAFLAVGAAVMMPSTLSIIRLTFEDDHQRAIAIGVWSAVASASAAVGPLIGGLLLEHFWWGSVFLINVPILLVTLPLAIRYVPSWKPDSRSPWDISSAFLALIGLVGLAYGVKELAHRAPSLTLAGATIIIGALFLWLFIRRQKRLAHPMIDFALFRNNVFTLAVIAGLLASGCLMGIDLVVSQRLQLVLSFTPLQAGLVFLPLSLGAFIAGPLSGAFMTRLGPSRLLGVAMLVYGIGATGLVACMHAPLWAQLVCMTIIGAGMGATASAASTTIMTSAPPRRAGMAASIEEVSYELGAAIGVTILGSLMTIVYTLTLVLPEGLNVAADVHDSLDLALLAAENLDGSSAALLLTHARAAFDQAYMWVLVVAATFLLGGALMLLVNHARNARRPGDPAHFDAT